MQPARELKYKKSTQKNNRSSNPVGSQESRKETINLMIKNPNTGLALLLREAPEAIQSSPSIFPQGNQGQTFASRFERDGVVNNKSHSSLASASQSHLVQEQSSDIRHRQVSPNFLSPAEPPGNRMNQTVSNSGASRYRLIRLSQG